MPVIYRIGCSGYYYPYWKNIFYPKNVSQKNWLSYYSSVFNTVELNGTFYRKPQLTALKKNAEATGREFRFSAKMSRYITHIKRLHDCKDEIDEFQDLLMNGLGKKMACFLFQMPPNFHFSEENLSRVLNTVPHSRDNVVEFRHQSWWNDTAAKELKKAGITFCNISFPGIHSYIIHTTSTFYKRFHGVPVLFRSEYPVKKLREFAGTIPDRAKEVFVYFNNTDSGNAFRNAMELMKIVGIGEKSQKNKKAQIEMHF